MTDKEFLRHDDRGMVYACPACDSAASLRIRTGRNIHADKDPDAPHYCEKCHTPVHDPVERAHGKESPLAAKLLEMDPDEVGA